MSVPVIRCALSDLLLADLAVSLVFCYDRRLDGRALISGFTEAVAEVPAFGGRLRPAGDGLEILCDGTGAEIRGFESPLTLPEAIGRLTKPDSGLVDYVDATARDGLAPVTRVRISHLADGATVVGCSWHHAVGDMSSFMTFVRHWSARSAGATAEAPLLVEDRAAFLDAMLPEKDSGRAGFRVVDEPEQAELRRVAEACTLADRTVQIFLTAPELARLRAQLEQETGGRLSTNDVVTAHIVSTVRHLDADAGERGLTVPVDLRRTLGVPRGTVGNLLGEVFLRTPAEVPTAELAAALRTALANFETEHLSLRTSHAVLAELGPQGLGSCVPLGFNPAERTFTVSSWRGFGAYGATFDGAAPVLVAPAISLPLPWVCWAVEGFDGAGVLCTLAVPAAMATRLRSPEARALLHAHRDPQDPMPELAAKLKRLL